ncbi:hypothetical protein VTL71DRAFT_7805 [Oculimacula yallundae]|uniref:Uncharacterized protein n=1 Tax=Oculimacula yallundae TaxID=86028 RepID=A0ABR4CWR2_9HELO
MVALLRNASAVSVRGNWIKRTGYWFSMNQRMVSVWLEMYREIVYFKKNSHKQNPHHRTSGSSPPRTTSRTHLYWPIPLAFILGQSNECSSPELLKLSSPGIVGTSEQLSRFSGKIYAGMMLMYRDWLNQQLPGSSPHSPDGDFRHATI